MNRKRRAANPVMDRSKDSISCLGSVSIMWLLGGGILQSLNPTPSPLLYVAIIDDFEYLDDLLRSIV